MPESTAYKTKGLTDTGKALKSFGKEVVGRRGGPVWSDSAAQFDHFLYKPATYTTTGPFLDKFTYTTTGTAVTNPTIKAVGASNATGGGGGVLMLTTDDVINTAEEISTPLLHTITQGGGFVFEARLKFYGAASNTVREAFFGLGDALTYTSGQPYTVTTASAITGTNVPTDWAGFAMSTVPTSGALFNTNIDGGGTDGTNVGYITSINNVDTAAALKFPQGGFSDGTNDGRYVMQAAGTTGAVNDATAFHTYRIEVGLDGKPNFYVDGKWGGVGGALTLTVPFGAYFTAVTKTGSAVNTSAVMELDYVFLSARSTWRT